MECTAQPSSLLFTPRSLYQSRVLRDCSADSDILWTPYKRPPQRPPFTVSPRQVYRIMPSEMSECLLLALWVLRHGWKMSHEKVIAISAHDFCTHFLTQVACIYQNNGFTSLLKIFLGEGEYLFTVLDVDPFQTSIEHNKFLRTITQRQTPGILEALSTAIFPLSLSPSSFSHTALFLWNNA